MRVSSLCLEYILEKETVVANSEHLKIIEKGVEVWNKWRDVNPNVSPDLRNANLDETDLCGADLSEADLSNADLSVSDLRLADLNEADLSGANLIGANLSKAGLSNSLLNGAYLIGASLIRANLIGSGLIKANLSSADLSLANLSYADLSEADLREADLSKADLGRADLNKVNLSEADLTEANLIETNLRESDIICTNLSGADLSRADLRLANLSESNLSGTDLSKANLSGANLSKTNLREAYLSEADLSKASLSEADLSEADLREAKLSVADLNKANLSKADLIEADLREANLSNTNLSGANINEADLSRANLSLANLSEADLSGTNLSKANLSGADLRESILDDGKGKSPAIITHAILHDVKFTDCNSNLFLDLAATAGLESAFFSDNQFLLNYLEEAFIQASNPKYKVRKYWPELVNAALDRIKALRALYKNQDPPKQLVEVVKLITDELIDHIKKHPNELDKIHHRQFEELIAEILSSYGWEVQITPSTKDGGYDIYGISKDESGVKNHWIIECKKYAKDRLVGIDIARNLYAVKTLYGVAGAMLATTSDFTKGVRNFKSSRYDFELKNYLKILEWINEYKPNPNGKLYIKNNKLIVPGEE